MKPVTNSAQQPTTDAGLAPPHGSRQIEHDGSRRTTGPAALPGSGFSTHRAESDLIAHLGRAFRRGELSDADLLGVAKTEFQNRISGLAQDRQAFRAFFEGHFGATDAAAIEKTRQQILDGTYKAPEVRFVGSDVLGEARGAYDADGDIIYLNRDAVDPANGFEELTRTFSEEMFEHFNHTVGDGDTAGDRGAKAMHALYGNELTAEQIAALDAEDDRGTIRVNGREVAVEFFDDDPEGEQEADDAAAAEDMAGEDIGTNPNDQQDGIGQSPGEDLPGDPSSGDGGRAATSPAVAARNETRQHAIDAITMNKGGAPAANVQQAADKATQSAADARAAADQAARDHGPTSSQAQDADRAAEVADADAELAQEEAAEAAEREENNPGPGPGVMSVNRVNVRIRQAVEAGVSEERATVLVAAMRDATTYKDRREAREVYMREVRAAERAQRQDNDNDDGDEGDE